MPFEARSSKACCKKEKQMTHEINRKEVKTRKQHRCHACGEVFEKSSRMTASTNVDGGDIYTLYYCEFCSELIDNWPEYFMDDMLFYNDCVKDYIYHCCGDENIKTPRELLSLLKKRSSGSK